MEQKKGQKVFCFDGKSYWQDGIFYPDQTPLEIPLGYQIPETLESMIARMVHNEQVYRNPTFENIDEADDFDCMDEEPILASKHEFTEMQEEHYRKEKKEALEAADDKILALRTRTRKPQGETNAPSPAEQQSQAATSQAAQ